MNTAVAFAPGHISGFFQPVYDPKNIYKTGSRGAGFSVALGATSHVSIEQSDIQKTVVYLNGSFIDSPLIETCIHQLIGTKPLMITSEIYLDLPLSQGFGMSAASALSVSYAVATCLDISLDVAVKAAHAAEISLKTGLGDVIGSWHGGFEIRSKPGLPPDGVIENFSQKCDMVLCVVDRGMATKEILSDEYKQESIDVFGGSCTDDLLKNPTIAQFFMLSELFTRKTGLANKRVLRAIDAAKPYGLASMCMLGNAIFATGETKKLVEILKNHGDVFVTEIDMNGARVLKTDH